MNTSPSFSWRLSCGQQKRHSFVLDQPGKGTISPPAEADGSEQKGNSEPASLARLTAIWMRPGMSRAPEDKIPKPGGASTAAMQCPEFAHGARHAATPKEPAGLTGCRQAKSPCRAGGSRQLLSRRGRVPLFVRQSWAQASWPGRSRAWGQSRALTTALPCGFRSRRAHGCPFLGAQLPSPQRRPGWDRQAAALAAPSHCAE